MLDNPLIRERDLHFLLYEVHRVDALWQSQAFQHCERDMVELYLDSVARFAREQALPLARELDESEVCLEKGGQGTLSIHPKVGHLYHALAELGMITADRSFDVEGAQLPKSVALAAQMLVMAANSNAISYILLTASAAHLIEAFGDPRLKNQFMTPMYAGQWTGTMALTEPEAGSSLGDLQCSARMLDRTTALGQAFIEDCGEGPEAPLPWPYVVRGQKLFITGGDQNFADNTVHLTLARIEGAAGDVRGISLFAVPKLRPEAGALVDNDVRVTQLLHKLGARAIPSVGLSFGESDRCLGWLIGEAGQGLAYMFQMMNEARIVVGGSGVALASAAYHAALGYARDRRQGRLPGQRGGAPVPIIEHTDVRRMLLKHKAIVDATMSLCIEAAHLHDRCGPGASGDDHTRLLGFLTPLVKTLPAEWGLCANNLAIQVLGGYGYCRDFLPELWMRDQRLNSLHEGTTGIQALDLLGRKTLDPRHAGFAEWAKVVGASIDGWRTRNPELTGLDRFAEYLQRTRKLVQGLGTAAQRGQLARVLGLADDFLQVVGTLTITWQLAKIAACRPENQEADPAQSGRLCALRYWLERELGGAAPALERLEKLAAADCDMRPEWF